MKFIKTPRPDSITHLNSLINNKLGIMKRLKDSRQLVEKDLRDLLGEINRSQFNITRVLGNIYSSQYPLEDLDRSEVEDTQLMMDYLSAIVMSEYWIPYKILDAESKHEELYKNKMGKLDSLSTMYLPVEALDTHRAITVLFLIKINDKHKVATLRDLYNIFGKLDINIKGRLFNLVDNFGDLSSHVVTSMINQGVSITPMDKEVIALTERLATISTGVATPKTIDTPIATIKYD